MAAWTNLTNPEYNLETVAYLARVSQISYSDGDPLDTWATENDFGPPTFFDVDNSQGFWVISDEVALIAFRGTSNIGHWIRDVRFIPTRQPWGKVHRGFDHGFDVIDDAIDAFADAAAGKPHVWVTGHSLGGAVAVLAAAHLKDKGLAPRVHTYGQPRVGWGDFADRFRSELPEKLHRFVNQDDIVTRLPPGFFYEHFGVVKTIKRPGLLELADPNAPALPALADEELPALSEDDFAALQQQLQSALPEDAGALESPEAALGMPDMFADHSINEYVRLLEDIRDESED